MYQHVIEVCAGIGMMGEGCQACGLSIQAVNDLSEPLCQFQQRQGQSNVVVGDIGKPEVIAGLHAAHPGSALITAGFSCQPWSQLGDGGKSSDDRSGCLTKVLELAFWLRAHSLLLECVEGAGKDPTVQRVIREFCQIMGFTFSQTDLHLDSIMPIKRSRWWCMLTGPDVPAFELRGLPKLQVPPVLGDLLPFCPAWDDYDMHQLCLDRYETNKFMEFGGLHSNILDVSKTVRTALHGWSNQLSGCPCGCRAYPFAESRLREKGIFGALIPTEGHMTTYLGTLPNTRHVHPWELALLHGATPNRVWKPSLRLAIAGIGQCAAPVQSCWVVAQCIHARTSVDGQAILPETFLWNHLTSVFAVVKQEQPSLFQHGSFQAYIQRVYQALGQSAQAHQRPASPIGDKSRDEETSHRTGRKDLKNEEPLADKKADQTQGLEDDNKQPGTRTPGPEKKTQQPGTGTRGPEKMEINQPGSGAPGSTCTPAEETQGLHPPMSFQAMPLSALVASGPALSTHDDAVVDHVEGSASVHENHSKAAQPMCFHAMPADTPDVTGPSPFSTKTKVPASPEPALCGDVSSTVEREANACHQPDQGGEITESASKRPRFDPGGGIPAFQRCASQVGDPSDDRRKAAQPMCFQAMPESTPGATGPTPFPPKTKVTPSNDPVPLKGSEIEVCRTASHPESLSAVEGSERKWSTEPVLSSDADAQASAELINCKEVDGPGDELFTQDMLEAAEQFEAKHPQPTGRSNQSCHVVQVVHDHASTPAFLSIPSEATVGSITVAEDKLGSLSQPIRANTCIGTMLRCASTTTPFQQIFLRSIEHCFEGHSCADGMMPFALTSATPCTRLQLLYHQEAWVGEDEMKYYLSMMTAAGSTRQGPIFLMPEHVLDEDVEPLLQKWICTLAPADAMPGDIISALWVSHHWFPVMLQLAEGSIRITTTPGGKEWIMLAIRGLGTHFSVHTTRIERIFNNDCGFQAVGWLINALFDPEFSSPAYKPRPVDETAAIAWRGLFEYHLHTQDLANHQVIPVALKFGGTLGHDVTSQLTQILLARGVPQNEVDARTESTITKVGRQPIVRALRSKDPWKELKQLCNQLTPRHQLVLQSEMQAAIEARAKQDRPFGDKTRKQKDVKSSKQIQLSAEDVTVPDGIFCDQHKGGLSQIPFGSIGPEARGIVVIQAASVVPYIRNGQPISKSALGLIVVDHHAPVLEGIGTIIRFPARCEKTGEAILLTGRLIQLGTVQVIRAAPEAQTKLEEVGNQVIRTVTYRDELENISWDKFIERPIRHVIQAIPILQGDNHQSPIIDVWDRQFLSEKLEKCRASEAVVFMSCFRLECPKEPLDLQGSGSAGHYLEPRSVDGRSPDQAFRVIWLKADKQQAILAAQSTSQWTSVVRSGRRFGLRVRLEDAEAVHRQHKPSTPFLDSDKLLTFHAGPFPHGTNRAALLKLFAQWQWAARPCQPRSRAPNGLGVHWEIQATVKPPYEVYQLQHADVLITEVVKKSPPQAPTRIDVQGSAKTIAALSAKTEASGSHDPWATDDPWKTYQPATKAAKVNETNRSDQVDMIVAKVLQKIKPPGASVTMPMDDGDTTMAGDDRVSELEQRMTSLEMSVQSHQQRQDVHNQEVDLKISGLQDQVLTLPKPPDHAKLTSFNASDRARSKAYVSHATPGLGRWPFLALIQFFILLTVARVGEASNPGPILGTTNPSGALGKGDLYTTLCKDASEPQIWGIAESHLTTPGLQKFRQELKFRGPQWRVHHGAPAPMVSQNMGTTGRKHSGVAVLANAPVRALATAWDGTTWATARVLASAVFVQNNWIKVGTFYGYARDAHTKATKTKTDDLLHCLTQRIVLQAKGYRAIIGDFNATTADLPQFEIWRQYGFRELQEVAATKWGREVEVTCKKTSTKDLVWLSPELVAKLESVHVDSTFFPDHSVVYGKFAPLDPFVPVPIWFKPHPLPWKDIPDDHPWPPMGADVCTIPQVFQEMENQVDDALRKASKPGLLHAQRGRCSVLAPALIHHPVAPLKPSRKSEFQIEYLGESYQHVQWCRQLRRLQSLSHLLRRDPVNAATSKHRHDLWRAIRSAPGFPGGFPKAWLLRGNVSQGAPVSLPKQVPTHEQAMLIFHDFQAEFRTLERTLNAHRRRTAKQRRTDNPNAIYADVSKPRSMPVQSVVTKTFVHVTHVSDDGLTVQYHPLQLSLDQEVATEHGWLSVSSHEAGVIQLAEEASLEVGDQLTQDTMQASKQQVFRAFQELWEPRWQKHETMPADAWEPFVTRMLAQVPAAPHPLVLPPIDAPQWNKAVKGKKAKTSAGPDGISREDLLKLPPALQDQLVVEVNRCDAHDIAWPEALMHGHITAIEKTPEAQGPQDFRPITILSLPYRTWATIRSRQILAHLDQVAPQGLCGNRPSHSATSIWWRIAADIEAAIHSGEGLSGFVTDVIKAFNCLARPVVYAIALHLGLPLAFVKLAQSGVSHQAPLHSGRGVFSSH
eukprot:s205_g5.t3